YPGGHVSKRPSPSVARSRDNNVWSECIELAGESSPHKTSTRRSVETTSLAWITNTASSRRCCRLPSRVGSPPRAIASAPNPHTGVATRSSTGPPTPLTRQHGAATELRSRRDPAATALPDAVVEESILAHHLREEPMSIQTDPYPATAPTTVATVPHRRR